MWRSPRRFYSPHGERYIEAPYRLFFTTRQKLSAFRHDRRPYEHDILMRTVADSCRGSTTRVFKLKREKTFHSRAFVTRGISILTPVVSLYRRPLGRILAGKIIQSHRARSKISKGRTKPYNRAQVLNLVSGKVSRHVPIGRFNCRINL